MGTHHCAPACTQLCHHALGSSQTQCSSWCNIIKKLFMAEYDQSAVHVEVRPKCMSMTLVTHWQKQPGSHGHMLCPLPFQYKVGMLHGRMSTSHHIIMHDLMHTKLAQNGHIGQQQFHANFMPQTNKGVKKRYLVEPAVPVEPASRVLRSNPATLLPICLIQPSFHLLTEQLL